MKQMRPPAGTSLRRLGAGLAFAVVFVGSLCAAPLTFRVNMSQQANLGNFVPAAGHAVELHGSFDGWGDGAHLS